MEEPFTFETDDEGAIAGSGSPQRSEPRDSMFLSATVRHIGTGVTWPLRVRNISAGGLMADCAGNFRRGDKVEVELRGISPQKATIAWTTHDRIGVAFEKPIDPLLTRKPVTHGRKPAVSKAVGTKRPWLRTV